MSDFFKHTIHFSHANGFPAATYRKYFSFLEKKYNVGYIDLLAHDPDYPVDDNWTNLVKEVIAVINKKYTEPVIGIGHSLGGALTYMAAIERPELFKAIILLDFPILGPVKSKFLELSKQIGLVNFITPAYRTKYRRAVLPDATVAYDYFKSKKLFKNFDKDCLRDYITYGMQKTPNGLQLKFSPDIEAQIYRTIPHHLPKISLQLKVPGGLIYGKSSTVVGHKDAKNIERNYHLRIQAISGGHLFPFENPELTASSTMSMIKLLVNECGHSV